MTSTLDSPPVAQTLAELYDNAAAQRRAPRPGGRPRSVTGSAQERADAASEAYMPISPMAGRLIYSLIRATRPATVVEFGMSYGISTLHLASAVRDNGIGRVVTTELSATKVAAAAHTFVTAGLDDVITILDGDALDTLTAVTGGIGVVLLDGWKDMYLDVLGVIEKQLSPGALILADNASSAGAAPYLDYVRSPGNGYTSVNFPGKETDTMELSCRL